LHCTAAFDCRAPRPYGETLHAEELNQVLHCDFMKIQTDSKKLKSKVGRNHYVSVIKDDVSRFVELVPVYYCQFHMFAETILFFWIVSRKRPQESSRSNGQVLTKFWKVRLNVCVVEHLVWKK
jgi:hypothetical protein